MSMTVEIQFEGIFGATGDTKRLFSSRIESEVFGELQTAHRTR